MVTAQRSRYAGERVLASTRLSQWGLALQFIAERPWLGWGAAAFSVLYPLRTGTWHGHSHNLPLELAVSSGVPVALALVGLVLVLLIALRRCSLHERLFDRAWWTAVLVLVAMHATDLPLFDSRLNIAGWILLAGLRLQFGRPRRQRSAQAERLLAVLLQLLLTQGAIEMAPGQDRVRGLPWFVHPLLQGGGGKTTAGPGIGSSSPLRAAR